MMAANSIIKQPAVRLLKSLMKLARLMTDIFQTAIATAYNSRIFVLLLTVEIPDIRNLKADMPTVIIFGIDAAIPPVRRVIL